MVGVWYRTDNFAHGFLILPISLYLIWNRRQRVASLTPRPNFWGLPILALLGCGWLLAHLVDAQAAEQLALVTMLPVLVWTVLGTAVTRALLFPLAFLLFAAPVGESLVSPLQDFTADFTVRALRLSGIPVFHGGRFITLSSGLWEVAEACSGVRYVIPSVMLGCLYASMMYQSWTRRIGFFIVAAAAPVLANGVRAYGIVMLAHFSDNKIAVGIDHLVYGWLFFGVLIFAMFWLGARWRQTARDDRLVLASDGDSKAPGFPVKALALVAFSSIAVLAVAPVCAHSLLIEAPVAGRLNATPPNVALPWQTLTARSEHWQPRFVGTSAQVSETYRAGRRLVDLYIAYYASQRQGAELINAENDLAGEKDWRPAAEGRTAAVVDGRPLDVNETLLRSSQGRTRLVWSWYWVADEFTSDPYHAKLLQVKGRILGLSPRAAAIAVAADYVDHPSEAADALSDLLMHTSSLRATLQGYSLAVSSDH